MRPGEGQRRRDAQDGYAPWVVRSAYRRAEPASDGPATVVAGILGLLGLAVIAALWFVR